ncbi:MAG: alpha/beta hydrolase [Chloroflexi bacterium]|nr:alpha/beta hydrolase [Chloroflexota bacterium]
MSGAPVRFLERDGWALAYRRTGGGPSLVLLHATLSSSAQLQSLADRLAASFTVIAVDRRGSGESRPPGAPPPGPIDVAVHVDDLAAILAAERVEPILAVGHSYGGCLALEFAARRPGLITGSWVYEPPYAPIGGPAVRATLADVARRTAAAGRRGGQGAAAEAFLSAVGGAGAIQGLSPAARQRIRLAGSAALADAALLGLEPDGLERIRCPVVVATGTASQPVYAAIAEALVERVPEAAREWIDGAAHGAPLTHSGIVAAAIEAFAARSGWTGFEPARLDPDSGSSR